MLLSQRKTVAEVVKQLGMTEVTYYPWCKEFGGMTVSQVDRLKEVEKENA